MRNTYDKRYYLSKAIWVAYLNNGETYYQDDEKESSWTQLKKYVESNEGIKISKMDFRFRSHVIHLPEQTGNLIYFAKGASLAFQENETKHSLIYGWLYKYPDPYLKILWYKTPELMLYDTKYRHLDDCDPNHIIRF